MDLPALADRLVDDGLNARWEPSDEGGRIDVECDLDALEQAVVLSVSQVEADVSPGLELVQLFAGLPFELSDAQLDTVVRQLPALNVLAPMGALSVFADDRVVFYRHVSMIESGRTSPVVESVWLAHFGINLLVPPLMALADLVEI